MVKFETFDCNGGTKCIKKLFLHMFYIWPEANIVKVPKATMRSTSSYYSFRILTELLLYFFSLLVKYRQFKKVKFCFKVILCWYGILPKIRYSKLLLDSTFVHLHPLYLLRSEGWIKIVLYKSHLAHFTRSNCTFL